MFGAAVSYYPEPFHVASILNSWLLPHAADRKMMDESMLAACFDEWARLAVVHC